MNFFYKLDLVIHEVQIVILYNLFTIVLLISDFKYNRQCNNIDVLELQIRCLMHTEKYTLAKQNVELAIQFASSVCYIVKYYLNSRNPHCTCLLFNWLCFVNLNKNKVHLPEVETALFNIVSYLSDENTHRYLRHI